MLARALILVAGSVAVANAFTAPIWSTALSGAVLGRSQLRSSMPSRRPAVSALKMQQSPIKLTPKLFTELDTDGSGTISAAEVIFFILKAQ